MIIVCLLLCLLLLLSFLVYASYSIQSGIYLRSFCKKHTAEKIVALTFDDGPKAGMTDVLLDELEKRNVKATFFLIGSQAELPENREIIRRMAEDGHQIGCHTYHHEQMTTLSENQQKQEILQRYQVVSGIIGDFSYALRPPYGCVNNAVCRSLNVPVILWSVDTEDWTGKWAGPLEV